MSKRPKKHLAKPRTYPPQSTSDTAPNTSESTNATDSSASETAAEQVATGMEVETTEGDLGEHDLSKPKVAEVVTGADGAVQEVVVEKGALFKKRFSVAPDRIESVEPPPGEDAAGTHSDEPDHSAAPSGVVTIAATAAEIDTIAAPGEPNDVLAEDQSPQDILSDVEETLPTVEGVRRIEARSAHVRRRKHHRPPSSATLIPPDASAAPGANKSTGPQALLAGSTQPSATQANDASADGGNPLAALGPGFLSGMAGNDASAVTSYSVTGSTTGYSQLWLMVLATPLLLAVQYSCAKIGRITQQGLGEVLRERYGLKVAAPAALILVVANVALIAADLVAIGSGLEILTGWAWEWFVVPVAVALWYLTVFQDFGRIKKIFLVLSLAFVAYLVTGIFSGAQWGEVLKDTFVPQLGAGFAGVASAVALLGATVSPYTMFWQVQGETEEKRPGTRQHQLRAALLDIGAGAISGNLVAYFIIVCTAATLFTHHQTITTAADAAKALQPLLGPFAQYLFAFGLIGAGLVAIPVLLASASYAVAGTVGWPASLWKRPWQNEGFYLILSVALLASLALALLRLNPVQLMFGANILQGTLSPIMVVLLLLVGNNRRIMSRERLGRWTNIGLIVTVLVMTTATVLLIVGLATGQTKPQSPLATAGDAGSKRVLGYYCTSARRAMPLRLIDATMPTRGLVTFQVVCLM